MSRQLYFDLPVTPDYSRAGFVPAASNAVAMALINTWRDWPLAKLVLSGPAGAGKTHLATIWAQDVSASIIDAIDLPNVDLAASAQGPVVIENVPNIAQDGPSQEALFHLHNMLQSAGHALLLTGQGTPNHWGMSLPDLQSRIDAAGHAALDLPDDTLLAAVLEKHFADRQLTPKSDVIPYLVRHMERSFAAASQIVTALDDHSLSTGSAITRRMAVTLLDKAASETR